MATVNNQLDLLISQTNIETNVKNINNMSSVINACTKNYNNLTTNVTDLSSEFNDFSTNIMDMSKNFTDMSTNIDDFSTNITDLSSTTNVFFNIGNSIDQMNNKLDASDIGSKKAGKGLLSFVKSAISLDTISKGMDIVDNYMKSGNELSKMNEELENQMGLQNKVNAAATRSSLSYTDMASAVSDIGGLETFKENDQAIAFTELMQKTLTVEGSDQNISDVTGALLDGKLQGEEFSSLTSGAPMVEEALSAYTGKSGEELQKLADQGKITANLLKNAMFAAGGEIDAEFSKQPKTFADIYTEIKNSAINAMSPLMDLVSKIINSPGVQGAINVIISAFGYIYEAIEAVTGFFVNNWPIIQTILMSVGFYLAYLGALAFAEFMKATAAELTALAPMLLIIAVIAAVIGVLQYLGVSFEDIFGFIGGVVGIAIAGIWNLFLGLIEFVLGLINYLINPFINFANFFGNLFTSPISSIIYLFQGMADNVLGIIETVATALDMVFGTKMAETVSGWRAGLKEMADTAVKEIAPNETYKGFNKLGLGTKDLGLSRMDYSASADNGRNIGTELYGKGSDLINSMSQGSKEFDYSKFQTTDDPIGTTSNPTQVEGSVDVSMEDEDLSYLRKMAERDYIANIATNTLAPNITVSFGDVHETADVNQLFGRIQTILKEQIAIAPEGVY